VVGEGLGESPITVLQGTVLVSDSTGIKGRENEESASSIEKSSPAPQAVHPYHPLILYPQRWHGSNYLSLSLDLCSS